MGWDRTPQSDLLRRVGDAPSSSCRPSHAGEGLSISSAGLYSHTTCPYARCADSSHCVPDKQTGRAPHACAASSPAMPARATTSASACSPSSSSPNQRAPNAWPAS